MQSSEEGLNALCVVPKKKAVLGKEAISERSEGQDETGLTKLLSQV